MSLIVVDEIFSPEERAREKQLSREEDARMLAEGLITVEELRIRNSPFAQLLVRPDFTRSRIR